MLHYQPKVDLQTTPHHRRRGARALAPPRARAAAAGRFIPLIEQTALIGPLTMIVIDQALVQVVAWRRRGIVLRGRGQPLGAQPARPRAARARRGAAARARRARGAARGRGHRERRDGRPRPRRARARGAARDGRRRLDRRLRHRQRVDRVPRRAARDRAQDRPLVRHRHPREDRDRAIVRSTIDLARNLGLDRRRRGHRDARTCSSTWRGRAARWARASASPARCRRRS